MTSLRHSLSHVQDQLETTEDGAFQVVYKVNAGGSGTGEFRCACRFKGTYVQIPVSPHPFCVTLHPHHFLLTYKMWTPTSYSVLGWQADLSDLRCTGYRNRVCTWQALSRWQLWWLSKAPSSCLEAARARWLLSLPAVLTLQYSPWVALQCLWQEQSFLLRAEIKELVGLELFKDWDQVPESIPSEWDWYRSLLGIGMPLSNRACNSNSFPPQGAYSPGQGREESIRFCISNVNLTSTVIGYLSQYSGLVLKSSVFLFYRSCVCVCVWRYHVHMFSYVLRPEVNIQFLLCLIFSLNLEFTNLSPLPNAPGVSDTGYWVWLFRVSVGHLSSPIHFIVWQALTNQAIFPTPSSYFVTLTLYFVSIQLLQGQFNLLNEQKGRKLSFLQVWGSFLNNPTSSFLIILTLRSELHFAPALKHPLLGTIHKQLSLEPYPRKATGLKTEAWVVGLSCHSN